MLSKCSICGGQRKVRQMGFMFSTCKACNGEGHVTLSQVMEQKTEHIEAAGLPPEVAQIGKKRNKASRSTKANGKAI